MRRLAVPNSSPFLARSDVFPSVPTRPVTLRRRAAAPAKSDLYTYIESLEPVRCQRVRFLRAVFARRAARERFLGNNCVRDWREIVRLARVDRTPHVSGRDEVSSSREVS